MRKSFAFILFLLCSSSQVFPGQKSAKMAFTVSAPSITAADVTLSVNGKTVAVTDAGTPPLAVVPDLKLDQLTTEVSEPIANTTVFVFDAMDTKEIEDRDMRKYVLKYLADAAAHKQSVGLVMMYGDGVLVVHDFRRGSAVLAAALAQANGGTAPAIPGAERTVAFEAQRLSAFAKGDYSTKVGDNFNLITNLESPVLMMQEISAGLRDVPGRKAIVWITAAEPFEIEDRDHSITTHLELNSGVGVNGMAVQSTKRTATDDQIRKLQPMWRSTLANLWDSGTAVYPVEARNPFYDRAAGPVYVATMNSVAQMTGGRAFYGTNDPLPFFASIATDNSASARVSFTLDVPNDNWQKVTVSSSKGKLLAPAGVFPPPDANPEDARKRAISTALNSHFGYLGVPFRLSVGEQTPNAGKKSVKFSVFLPPNAGIVDEKGGQVNIDIAAVALGKKDEKAGTMAASAGGKLPPEALKQISENGVNVSKTIDVPPGEYVLRVVVRDNVTGRVGSLDTSLKVN